MFKIKIIAVGKVKEKYYLDAISEYLKRLSRYAEVKVVEVKEENFLEGANESEKTLILQKEGLNIQKEIKGKAYALAIEGKKYSSEGLASLIESVKNSSSDLTFIIGGSYGIDKSVKNSCSGLISFSDMTFPHTLTRVILVEQLYRAFNILDGGKYHK